MSDHPDAKLAYFPRWAGCVVPGNLPMGTWRDFSTPCGARRSRGTICRTSLRVAWSRCNTHRLVDALYVELAEQLRAPLITADSRLAGGTPQAQVPQHASVWILTTSLVSGSHDLASPIPQRASNGDVLISP